VKLADVAIPLLEKDWKDCKKVINKSFKDRNDTHDYVNSVVSLLVKNKSAGMEPNSGSGGGGGRGGRIDWSGSAEAGSAATHLR
jgi:hypothetical protein